MHEMSGPAFVTLIVDNLEMSRQFYKEKIGLQLSVQERPNAQTPHKETEVTAPPPPDPNSAPSASPGLGLHSSVKKWPTTQTFDTKPCPIAIQQAEPESPKSASPGQGILVWFHTADSQSMHDQLKKLGVYIARGLEEGPFGKTFSFQDPDGYVLGVYDGA